MFEAAMGDLVSRHLEKSCSFHNVAYYILLCCMFHREERERGERERERQRERTN